MMTLRRADDRGQVDMGWLKSQHTFSFGEYYDPRHMHFRALRVINDDIIDGGTGFGMHPHRDMEIVTVVLTGAVKHRDSMGNEAVIRPGEVQRMSAGTGILHSEYNASPTDPLHLLQIWLLPKEKGIEPGYEQKMFDLTQPGLYHLASGSGAAGAVAIHQDTELYRLRLEGNAHTHTFAPDRHMWVQVITGPLQVGDVVLQAGDGLAISRESSVTLAAQGSADALLFDLA